MRLIDADALIEALVMWRDNDPHRKIRTLWERWARKTGINVLIKVGSAFPTIEAEPVRHGRWVGLEYDGYADGYPVYDVWECSECGEEVKGEDVPITHPWCHGCGAKMDKEE